MEQRKDLKIQPVQVASTDPAFITGLMPSGPDESQDSAEDTGGSASQVERDDAATAADVDDTSADSVADDTADADADEDKGAAAESEDSADADADADAVPDPDKPVFEALDHRGSITIDARGVQFTLDDQKAEWTWDEIGAMEYQTSRFGRRLTVTVHTPDRRWYPNEVQAPSKSTLKKWTSLLDEILDVYFPDEEEAAEESAKDADESKEAEESAAEATEAEADAKAADDTEADAKAGDATSSDEKSAAEKSAKDRTAGDEPAAKKASAGKAAATATTKKGATKKAAAKKEPAKAEPATKD